MQKNEAIQHIQNLIDSAKTLRKKQKFSPDFVKWMRDIQIAIENIFGNSSQHLKDYENIHNVFKFISTNVPEYKLDKAFIQGLDDAEAIFKSMVEEIQKFWPDSSTLTKYESQIPTKTTTTLLPIPVFYSYAEEDEQFRVDLEKHLTMLQRDGIIAGWHFRKISAGREWEGLIDSNLLQSRIILLLISADFISSGYCYDVEMGKAMKLHDSNSARVIPVILRPVDWQTAPFAKLQALPKSGKPITTWSNRDEAFLDIAQGIRKVCDELQFAKNLNSSSPSNLIKLPEEDQTRQTTITYCSRCGVKPGKSSSCFDYGPHNFKSYSGDVYCLRCGVKPGESSSCFDYGPHNLKSYSGDVYCLRCGVKPGKSSSCFDYGPHNFNL